MPTIGWNENAPAGQDSLGIGDEEIRSLKSAVRTALDSEHVYPAAGGDAGVHRLGSGRPFVGAQSLVSSSGTDGKLMWASDTSQFFHVGSTGTSLIGGPRVLSMGSYPGGAPPQRIQWVMEAGDGAVTDATSGQTTITFPNSGFSGRPFTTLTVLSGTSLNAVAQVFTASATQMVVQVQVASSGASVVRSFFWHSIGSRAV